MIATHLLLFALFISALVVGSIAGNNQVNTASDEKRRAWLHIGESKSGTTHIQGYLMQHRDDLRSAGLEAKFIKGSSAADFSEPQEFQRIIDSALNERRDLMISTEQMQTYDLTMIQELKEMLRGFDEVTIICGVREPLSRALSSFNENSHRFFPAPFGTLIMHHVQRITDLGLWEATFGADSIHIIDYNGVLSSSVDIVHVVLCEIAGYYCSETSKLRKVKHENSSRDFMLLPLFHYLMAATGRKMCPAAPKNTVDDGWRVLNEEAMPEMNVDLPIVPFIAMDMLHLAGEMQYMEMQERFQHYHWHHKNRTANVEARDAVEYHELAMWQMMQVPSWQHWLDDLVHWFDKGGYNHKCKKWRIFPGYLQPHVEAAIVKKKQNNHKKKKHGKGSG